MKRIHPIVAIIGVILTLIVANYWPTQVTRGVSTINPDHSGIISARQRLAALDAAGGFGTHAQWVRLVAPSASTMKRSPQATPVVTSRAIDPRFQLASITAANRDLNNPPNPFPKAIPAGHISINGAVAHPQRLIARLADGADISQFKALLPDGQVLNEPSEQHGLVVIQTPQAAVEENPAVVLQTHAKTLLESGKVTFAEPDYLVSTISTPTDYGYSSGWQWGLRNTGRWGTAGIDIGAAEAWKKTTGSRDIIVAVIDTGIRVTHRDLAANMWINTDEVAGNGVDDDNDGYVDNIHGIDAVDNDGSPNDAHSHGTHVAGTIGAAANDGNLCVGVAWNAQLMACKFLDASGYGYSSGAVRCIDFAVANGARVLNCSWGSWGRSQAIQDALARAASAGVVCVAAAGNAGTNTDRMRHFPSGYDLDNVISVGAVDLNGNPPSWSNYGRVSVDVFAPGVSILSSTAYSDSSYSFWSGTSMAAPHVAGIAALMLSIKPDLTVTEIKSGILNTSMLHDSLNGLCVSGGLANADNALQANGDDELEVELTASVDTLTAGEGVRFYARVSDVNPVTGATVTGTAGSTSLLFAETGTNGDALADDAVYTATYTPPADPSIFQITVDVTANAAGKSTGRATRQFTVLHPPTNDNFANAKVLTGNRARFSGTNSGASAEAGEPRHYYWAAKRSVWIKWTAPHTGIAMATTRGSKFDTVMAVYTGSKLDSLRVRARDDDRGGNLTSRVWFWARAGHTYHIAIDGYNGAEGEIRGQLRLTRPWWWRWYRR